VSWNMPDGATTDQYDRYCGAYDPPEPEEPESTWECPVCHWIGEPRLLDLCWEMGDEEFLLFECPNCRHRDPYVDRLPAIVPALEPAAAIMARVLADYTIADVYTSEPLRKPAASMQWELDYRDYREVA